MVLERICVLLFMNLKKNNFKILKKFKLPHSLGGFYATFTEFLGFKPYMDEGKLMGLAGYGKHSSSIQKKISKFVSFNARDCKYEINKKFRYAGNHNFGKDLLIISLSYLEIKEIKELVLLKINILT